MVKTLVLLCGGVSPEHEISLRSVKNILGSVDRNKYHIHVIGISKTGHWYLLDETEIGETIADGGQKVALDPGSRECFKVESGSIGSVDVVFPVLHGPNGEDGTVQGLLEVLNVPYVGPGVLGSSVSMDKDTTKRLLRQEGVNVANWRLVRSAEQIPAYEEIVDYLGPTVFVKPANMGSSVGVNRATNEKEYNEAVEEALRYDSKVLIEELLEGRELECAVLGNTDPKASGVGEVKSGTIYSYDEKYSDTSSAQTIIPANVTENELILLKKTAIEAYKALNCKGLSRVDVFLSSTGEVFVNEVNTMPGFTNISMYPQLWEQEGVPYTELIDQLIDLAIEAFNGKE